MRGRLLLEHLDPQQMDAGAFTDLLYALAIEDSSGGFVSRAESRKFLDDHLEDWGALAWGETDRPTYEEREGLREMLNVMDDGQPIVTRNRDG